MLRAVVVLRRLAVSGALALGACTALAAGGAPSTPSYAPDPSVRGAPPLDGEIWVVETPEYAARLRQLDDAGRLVFLEDKAGTSQDPFASGPGKPGGFLTFLLWIENRSSGSLVFGPQNCRLVGRDKDARYPLDLPQIQTSYDMLRQPVPDALIAARKALFDGQVILAPGKSAAGLLVYRALDPRTKSFVVEIELSPPSGVAARFEAPYRRVKR